jgi:hypothetical protein
VAIYHLNTVAASWLEQFMTGADDYTGLILPVILKMAGKS